MLVECFGKIVQDSKYKERQKPGSHISKRSLKALQSSKRKPDPAHMKDLSDISETAPYPEDGASGQLKDVQNFEQLEFELQNCKLEISRLQEEVAVWENMAANLSEQVQVRDSRVQVLLQELNTCKTTCERLRKQNCNCWDSERSTSGRKNMPQSSCKLSEKFGDMSAEREQRFISRAAPFASLDSAGAADSTEGFTMNNVRNCLGDIVSSKHRNIPQVAFYSLREKLENIQHEVASSSKRVRSTEAKLQTLLAESLDQILTFESSTFSKDEGHSCDSTAVARHIAEPPTVLCSAKCMTPRSRHRGGQVQDDVYDGSCSRRASLPVEELLTASKANAENTSLSTEVRECRWSSEADTGFGQRTGHAAASQIGQSGGARLAFAPSSCTYDSRKWLFSIPELVRSRTRDKLGWVEAISKELQRCTQGNAESVLERIKQEGSFQRLSDARSAFGVYVCDVFRQNANAVFDVEEVVPRVGASNSDA
uniref:Uncharacterized protein n=1 Tax=Tetraselmis sp. GSL018 TaxID=582737 RepID=A0A061QVW1_9CHLO|mmetsp:Transcript_11956/g.28368  ORF Transcript_11956/g.28368 Transcript_11956/m.28368 type:complete len:482 (-) Transcript_11956:187-1632(-)|eukprot:CAMPEP_0177606790 /NCGR_PEP_ID=MMETSP0419_2-20121207/17508_1 /TAXON_ID=582737 /ORGANISM="Tetraselmis sp., Strain GSL018" /LENGTH=481 /DNA_ID=CAMNT_0019101201 /DNA_START=46 /DNA_END=1491 /DNA_ORIENTATION=+